LAYVVLEHPGDKVVDLLAGLVVTAALVMLFLGVLTLDEAHRVFKAKVAAVIKLVVIDRIVNLGLDQNLLIVNLALHYGKVPQGIDLVPKVVDIDKRLDLFNLGVSQKVVVIQVRRLNEDVSVFVLVFLLEDLVVNPKILARVEIDKDLAGRPDIKLDPVLEGETVRLVDVKDIALRSPFFLGFIHPQKADRITVNLKDVLCLVALDNVGKAEHFDNVDKVLDDRIGKLGMSLTDDIDNLAAVGKYENDNNLKDRVSLAGPRAALVNDVIVLVLDLTRLGINAGRLESLLIDNKDGGDRKVNLGNPSYIDAVGLFYHIGKISNKIGRPESRPIAKTNH
jgi:hypothetical protein